jgi:hypothetical protein
VEPVSIRVALRVPAANRRGEGEPTAKSGAAAGGSIAIGAGTVVVDGLADDESRLYAVAR